MQRLLLISVLSLFGITGHTLDWPRFRGADGSGSADVADMPVTWSASENLRWRCELPGEGASTPVHRDGRIYLTAYSGYDRQERNLDFDAMRLHILAIDAADGSLLWRQDITPLVPQRHGGKGGTRWHGYATPTPAVDAERLYVSFGHNGIFAFDLEGRQLWSCDIGERADNWGNGASLALLNDKLVVNAGCESDRLLAIDGASGDIVWEASGIGRSWSTPVVHRCSNGDDVVLNINGGIAGYRGTDGSRLWHVSGARDYATTSPIIIDDLVYSSTRNTHGGTASMAIGIADCADELLWKNEALGAVVSSPVLVEGRLYWSAIDGRTHRDLRGIVCVNAQDGSLLWRRGLDPMPETLYASPLAADGKIYFQSLYNGTYVVAADAEFRLLAHNRIESDASAFNASPVPLSDGRLLLRSDRALYCIGE
jgi:outer membrane protein assembly factor BamB